MSTEFPILRLGLAGFSAEDHDRISSRLAKWSPAQVSWRLSSFSDADAWWVHGGRVHPLPDGTLRVSPGKPDARSLQLSLAEVDRPVAFSEPLAAGQLEPSFTFDLKQEATVTALLQKITAWLQPQVAQFSLASAILQQERVLGTGCFRVKVDGKVIAVVDMVGDIGLLPTVGPRSFEHAVWQRWPGPVKVLPEHFMRTDLSRVMWQLSNRSTRDMLPSHYRERVLHYRRPPRLPRNSLKDSHLLVLRELSAHSATLAQLQQRTGLAEKELSSVLQALYLVGSITSNPKRAALQARPAAPGGPASSLPASVVPSALGAGVDSAPAPALPRPNSADMTAPAPLWPSD